LLADFPDGKSCNQLSAIWNDNSRSEYPQLIIHGPLAKMVLEDDHWFGRGTDQNEKKDNGLGTSAPF
jgi:hypothetical protein